MAGQLIDVDGEVEPFSRILKDIFHGTQQIEVSREWPQAGEFYKTVSRTIFQYHKGEYDRLNAVLRKRDPPTDVEQLLLTNPEYVHVRVRRFTRKPSEMANGLLKLKEAWCTQTYNGKPVFGEKQLKSFDGLIQLAKDGYLSDPPGVVVHFSRGTDRNGLTLWRTARGSSSNEGVHNKLHEDLNIENGSIEYVHLLLHAYIDRYNQKAAIRNIPGTVDYGHFNMQYKQITNEAMINICGKPKYPDLVGRNEFYIPGQTTVGVVRIFNEDPTQYLVEKGVAKPTKGDKKFLADRSGSSIPFTPVSRWGPEARLFAKLYNELLLEPAGASRDTVNFEKLAEKWMDSDEIDAQTIYAKTPVQLKYFFKKFYRKKREAAHLRKLMQDRGYNPDQYRSFAASSDESSSDSGEESAEEVLDEVDPPLLDLHDGDGMGEELAAQLEARATLTASGPAPITPAPALGGMASTYQPSTEQEAPQRRGRTCTICGQKGCPGNNNQVNCRLRRSQSPLVPQPAQYVHQAPHAPLTAQNVQQLPGYMHPGYYAPTAYRFNPYPLPMYNPQPHPGAVPLRPNTLGLLRQQSTTSSQRSSQSLQGLAPKTVPKCSGCNRPLRECGKRVTGHCSGLRS